jgi:hypothetical protein
MKDDWSYELWDAVDRLKAILTEHPDAKVHTYEHHGLEFGYVEETNSVDFS